MRGSARRSVFWRAAPLYVTNSVLQVTSNPDWRFCFQLCVEGYRDLLRSFRCPEGALISLLALAVDKGTLTHTEVQDIVQDLRIDHALAVASKI